MRIRFKALKPSDEDLTQTRPEGPAARQRASDRAPKPAESQPPDRSGVSGRKGAKDSEKVARSAATKVVEPKVPEPKRRDPRRE